MLEKHTAIQLFMVPLEKKSLANTYLRVGYRFNILGYLIHLYCELTSKVLNLLRLNTHCLSKGICAYGTSINVIFKKVGYK